MTTLKERMKASRKAAGLTQKELSKVSGVTQQTISDLERRDTATSRFLAPIAAALDVNLMWLATGDGQKSNYSPAPTGANSLVAQLDEAAKIRLCRKLLDMMTAESKTRIFEYLLSQE